MYRKLPVIAVACCLIASRAPAAVQDLDWDVGRQPSISVPLEPGEYRLIVHGAVFGANYKQSIVVDTIPVPGLPQIASVPGPGYAKPEEKEKPAPPPPEPEHGMADKKPDPCGPYKTQLQNLLSDASSAYLKPELGKRGAEEKLSFALIALLTAIDAPPANCSADATTRQAYSTLVDASKFVFKPVTVKRGQILKAQFSRALGEDPEGLKFAYELSTGKRGSWQASYGFGITPDNDRHYYTKKGDEADTFVITQQHDSGGVQPNAAIFYTWLPANWEATYCSFGIAGGIGIDQNSLVLLLGPHLTFNQNLGIVAGVALHQETRLSGEYEVGQTVTENLTSAALEEKINQTSWFIGVTYRFAEAPK